MTFFRIITIFFVLAKHRLDRNLPPNPPLAARLLLLLLRLFPTPKASGAVSVRLALEELGPIFIKFGQVLSTRKDLFSEELSNELQKLQDQVPPFDPEKAKEIIEISLGRKIEDAFSRFDDEPLASASVAQIHSASLITSQGDVEVVVKVIRPKVDRAIRRDLKVMYFTARLLERLWDEGKRLHPVEIVADYDRTIMGELNLALETANTLKLRENWDLSGKLYVPEVYPDFCSKDVMVMERIYGVTATDLATLKANNTNLKKLAHLGVEIFFTQVFEDNFFHADMHPGNVFVDISDPENPTYIALDCAIIGSLTENDKQYLAKNLLAFFHRDYMEVARLHIQSGWVPADTNQNEFAAVIRSVCDPFFQKPIKEISFGKVLLSLFQTARQFNMEIQPQLVLLQKTLINIEGMGRQIYPDLDLWETAAPFMERWMANRMGIQGLIKRISDNAPRWLEQLPELPDLAYNTMTQIKQLGETNREQSETIREVRDALHAQAKRTRYQRLGGAALIAAIFSMLFPLAGYATEINPIIPGSLLGTLGIYWMYLHS